MLYDTATNILGVRMHTQMMIKFASTSPMTGVAGRLQGSFEGGYLASAEMWHRIESLRVCGCSRFEDQLGEQSGRMKYSMCRFKLVFVHSRLVCKERRNFVLGETHLVEVEHIERRSEFASRRVKAGRS